MLHQASCYYLDFLIYNKLGENPVLAVEVDGYEYHKIERRQTERDVMKNEILEKYNIPLLRFSTTASGEKESLIECLKNIEKIINDKSLHFLDDCTTS